MGINLKVIHEEVTRSSHTLRVSRSVNLRETLIFREYCSDGGDRLDVFLNKGDRLLFSYDFPDDEDLTSTKFTKEGERWLQRDNWASGLVARDAVRAVVDGYYDVDIVD